jgi:nucleotide-binding universal stress UspA family protein
MINRILVGTDTTASADLAVTAAADLARAHRAELVVVYVRPLADAREAVDPAKLPDPAGYLRTMPGRFPDLAVRTRLEAGEPGRALSDVAEEVAADVIVVGNRGTHGRKRWFLRSVPSAVVRHSPCSVYVVDTRVAQ